MMKNTNLIIALTFAGIFGAALVYLILWYIHRYIHQRCLDLEHWFHILSPRHAKTDVEKTEARETSKHRSRSRKRERGRWGSRPHYDGEGNADWSGQSDVERATPMMQLDAPHQPYEQSYYPVQGWQDQNQVANQIMYGQPVPWQIQGVAQMTPMAMPQQPFPQMATGMPEPAQYQPRYQDRPKHRQVYSETTTSHVSRTGRHKSPLVKEKAPKVRAVEHVDYIHICDEYPPVVQEALKRAVPRPCSSSSSSCSSQTSESTQEIARASIPRATPGFTSMPPFQFPQYPQMATRAWNAPRSYPRQWMDDGMGANVKARYAPFPPLSGHAERTCRKRRPAPAPSNTHPERSKRELTVSLLSGASAPRSRAYERRRQRTVSPMGGPQIRRHADPKSENRMEGNECTSASEAEKVVDGRRDAEPEGGGRNVEEIPRFSPMPIPIVEEPCTPTSDNARV